MSSIAYLVLALATSPHFSVAFWCGDLLNRAQHPAANNPPRQAVNNL